MGELGVMYLEDFNKFLRSIDLGGYRKQYQPIKLVEMDLPKEILAISLLYEIYWNEKRFLNFNDFYQEYLKTHKNEIEEFRKKITMCEDCFYRGLPARIYRTWASIITQIHAGYVAESVFGKGTVKMSEELDRKKVDFQVTYKDNVLNYQVKKKSFSNEVRREIGSENKISGEFINIEYEVPSSDYFENPKKKNGEYKLPYRRFVENKKLFRFPNGFVVFTPLAFMSKKEEIDMVSK